MIEKLEQRLEQAIADENWEKADKISYFLDLQMAREKTKSELVHAERKSIMALLGAAVTAIVSLGTFLATQF